MARIRNRYRRSILIVISLILYLVFAKVWGLLFLLAICVGSFFIGKHICGKKVLLIVSITSIVAALLFTRYFKFNNELISVIGFSYIALQIISYLVDVYKGKYEYCDSISNFILFCFFFPTIWIGPINRYNEVTTYYQEYDGNFKDNLYNGLLRASWGLFKKYLIAARIGLIVNQIVSNDASGFNVLLALLAYSVQLYCDFSGGIDLVIAVSQVCGIKLKENFNNPFSSLSIKMFWRNWHMSLGSFLKDYVYIPLGGNRVTKIRKVINSVITFAVSGLWHGTNYILWGVIHGLLSSIDYTINNKLIARTINYLVVSLLWCFFIYPDSLTALVKVASIFTFEAINITITIPEITIIVVAIIILFLVERKGKSWMNYSSNTKLAISLLIILVVALLGCYGIGFNQSDFIYSRF